MAATRLTVLILGGYGVFGGRLAELLADEPRVTLVVAGRSLQKAEAFCARLAGRAEARPLAFDRNGDGAAQLREAKPDMVVDASGPFQSYGNDPYRLVRACLALGIDYLDLADAPDFVSGITRFDQKARARGVVLLSGVSSFPVLTAAVVRDLAAGMDRVETVEAGIAPSPYANVGENVIRAIAGYAGRPVSILRDGRRTVRHAFVDTRRYTIGPPGEIPLDRIRFSLVDVPDLQVLPELWPELRAVWMGAGPVPAILHRVLRGLAWTVRLRLLPSLTPLVPLMIGVMNRWSWGEHRGGMYVAVQGADAQGQPLERAWHLLAEGNSGPLIPSMAAEAVIRRVLDGRRPPAGARPAATDLELADYAPLFARQAIVAGRWQQQPAGASLYRRVLGDAWAALPAPLQAMHDVGGGLRAEGVASVERGSGLLARLVAALFRFPRAGRDVPVRVSFEPRDGREIWRRSFGRDGFTSIQYAGRGRFERLLCESFGPFTFGLALVARDGRLNLIVRRWSFCGIPLPRALAPRGDSSEFVQDGRFNFDVEIVLPMIGRVVRYRGWLVPGAPAPVAAPEAPLVERMIPFGATAQDLMQERPR